jgi:hypothetical protein
VLIATAVLVLRTHPVRLDHLDRPDPVESDSHPVHLADHPADHPADHEPAAALGKCSARHTPADSDTHQAYHSAGRPAAVAGSSPVCPDPDPDPVGAAGSSVVGRGRIGLAEFPAGDRLG